MILEKMLARASYGSYILGAVSELLIVADMVFRGVTGINILLAILSVGFVFTMLSSKKLEDFMIERYQEPTFPRSKTEVTTFQMRIAILRLQTSALWTLWFSLLAGCLAFSLAGDSGLSKIILSVMIACIFFAIPLRVFAAAALFKAKPIGQQF